MAKPRWIARLIGEPNKKEELLAFLARLQRRGVLDAEALSMMEGVLQISEMRIGDVMIPNADVADLTAGDSYADIVRVVNESGHSRYPVFDPSRERVLGVLLAKDLLQFAGGREGEFKLEAVMRPAEVEPTSKRLDELLREFRKNRRHIVIVVDEYGLPAGLVTIEDILERIVGQIEDEHDPPEDDDIVQTGENAWRVKGTTVIGDFNRAFGVALKNKRFTTIGGWLANRMGGVPKTGATLSVYGLSITVSDADGRRARIVEVVKENGETAAAAGKDRED